MKGIFLLFSYMTKISVPKVEYDEVELGKSMKYFPLVGFVMGIIICLTCYALHFIFPRISKPILIMLSVFIEVLLTGGLHLKGLTKTMDTVFSYKTKLKRLETMKTQELSINGGISLIIYFILKIALLNEILILFGGKVYLVYILMLIFARLNAVFNCATAIPAKQIGIGKYFVENTNLSNFFYSLFLSIVLSVITIGLIPIGKAIIDSKFVISNILAIIILLVLAFVFHNTIRKKIGGVTKDTIGAVLETSELLFLFIFYLVSITLI